METVLELSIYFGMPILLLSIVSLPIFYIIYRDSPKPKRDGPLALLIVGSLGAGFVAFKIGNDIGIAVGCAIPGSGNLCGLVGFIGLGPLFAGAAIFAIALAWLLYCRGAPY